MDNSFRNDWAIVTSGTLNNFNSCTISWGCFGYLWNKEIITIYILQDIQVNF